jgi:hypothetical protein
MFYQRGNRKHIDHNKWAIRMDVAQYQTTSLEQSTEIK